MRKLCVFESVSVDGFFTDSNDDVNWAHAGREDAEFASWVGANASSGRELLFGRKTYQMMESYWPSPMAAEQMPEVAKGMNAAKKYVISRTIHPTWKNTTLLDGDPVGAVQKLKKTNGSNITVLGSGCVAALLAEAGLVDEYLFVIIPIALGSGRTLFPQRNKLRLIDARSFRCGNVAVTYAV